MRQKFLRYSLGSDLIIYMTRVLIGFLIGYFLYVRFPEYSLYWTIISIILVISPEDHEARKIAYDRTKANFIGSVIGLACYFLHLNQIWSMVVGIVIAMIICKLLNILVVARTAMVALIIVIIHEQEQQTYWGALDRFICVTLGCFIGLLIVLSTSNLILKLRRKTGLIES